MTSRTPYPTLIHSLLLEFSECRSDWQSQRISILCQIKKCIQLNPRNLAHPKIGSLTAAELFEFVIEVLSNIKSKDCEMFPDEPSRKLLMYVMSLMLKLWARDGESARNIYNGILDLIEQREHCIDGCLQFMICFVDTMQDSGNSLQKGAWGSQDPCQPHGTIEYCQYQHYFVHHMLNEFIGLANIFFERAMVKNNTSSSFQPDLRKSQSISESSAGESVTAILHCNDDSLPPLIDTPEKKQSEYSENFRLYSIKASENHIKLLIRLFSACISYDFQYLSRNQRQDEPYQNTYQIILPTKFSKHCKFQEFDLLLKEDSTTEKLNYLFLVTEQCNWLKVDIIRLLAVMSRIHFRYFKNKALHRVFLENIGSVLLNLMTGLDFEEDIREALNADDCRGQQHRLEFKIDLCLAFGDALTILLNHQQVFYTLEPSLLTQFLIQLHEFICTHLLETSIANSADRSPNANKLQLSLENYILLHAKFVNVLTALRSNFEIYMGSNERAIEELLNVISEVGSKYEDYLHQHIICHASRLSMGDLKILLELFKVYRPRISCTSPFPKMYHLLCRFEHGFHMTAGAVKELHPWQLQNYTEYVNECIVELNSILKESIKHAQTSEYAQMDNLVKETVLPYILNLLVRECRRELLDYCRSVQLDMLVIVQWLVTKSIYRNCDCELIQDILTIENEQQRYYGYPSKNGEFLEANIPTDLIQAYRTQKQKLISCILNDCTSSFCHLYRNQELELLARILFTLLSPQHYRRYRHQINELFGLARTGRYSFTASPRTQYTMLMQVLEQIKKNRYVFSCRDKCNRVYSILRDQYLHLYETPRRMVSLQLLTMVMELESENLSMQEDEIAQLMEGLVPELANWSQTEHKELTVDLLLVRNCTYLLGMLRKHRQSIVSTSPQYASLIVSARSILSASRKSITDSKEASHLFTVYWQLANICAFAYFDHIFLPRSQAGILQEGPNSTLPKMTGNLLHLHANSDYVQDHHVSRRLYNFMTVQLFREFDQHIQDHNIKHQLISIVIRQILSSVEGKVQQLWDSYTFADPTWPHPENLERTLNPDMLIMMLSVHENTLGYLISQHPAVTRQFCQNQVLIQSMQVMEDKGLPAAIQSINLFYDGQNGRNTVNGTNQPKLKQSPSPNEDDENPTESDVDNLKSQVLGSSQKKHHRQSHQQIEDRKQPFESPPYQQSRLEIQINISRLKPNHSEEELEAETDMPRIQCVQQEGDPSPNVQ